MEDGLTGFLTGDVDGMAVAFGRINEIDPLKCAQRSRQRFSPSVLAAAYEKLYLRQLGVPQASTSPATPSSLLDVVTENDRQS